MAAIDNIHDHNIDVDNRVIYLQSHDDSGVDAGVEHRVADTFLKNIHILNTGGKLPITVEMSLIGGEWSAGMIIFEAIRESKAPVTIRVRGQAESMSSVILQSADHRVVSKYSYFMCHYGSCYFDGDYQTMQTTSQWQKTIVDQMVDIYVEKMLKSKWAKDKYGIPTERQVKSFLRRKMKDGDWYMFGDEIVYYGFADEVVK